MKIGIIREGKVPPDKRVTLTPIQCREAMRLYADLTIVVQPSEIRAYTDNEYTSEGIQLQQDLSDCDVLVGVKEVNIEVPANDYLLIFFVYHI